MKQHLSSLFFVLTLVAPDLVNSFWQNDWNIRQTPPDQDETLQKNTTNTPEPNHYPIDISFPIFHGFTTDENFLREQGVDPIWVKQRSEFYENIVQGCRDFYGKFGHLCDDTEKDRLAMNLRQPQSVYNYTDTGFKKIRAPDTVMNILKDYWDMNNANREVEKWTKGYTYVNIWDSPTSMVSIENTKLRGGGHALKDRIWEAVRPTIEEWTGNKVSPTSMYGIRIYTHGSILAPHVDRLPLVSSCIINVAQDVEEDWPLEVYGRDNRAYNVTMKPGDMVMYESHSLIHGRPFPLKGKFYANIFIHFEPTGIRLTESEGATSMERALFSSSKDGLPIYVKDDSPEASYWRNTNGISSTRNRSPRAASDVYAKGLHRAAAIGDMESIVEMAKRKNKLLFEKDENGWQPIHEASRSGHSNIVKLLVEHGANVNERTNEGVGGTPLHYAIEGNGKDHPIVDFLTSIGAVDIGPDL